ncbi:MAG TPA: acyl-CoA dehydrogenase family protein [Acidimicrobiales bacterium]
MSSRRTRGTHERGAKPALYGSKSPHFAHLWVHRFKKVHFIREFARDSYIYTIFEGPSEIQRLIIARAISGVQIR